MKAVLVVSVLLTLSGCSIISPKVGPQLAKAAQKYCATLTEAERQYVRQQVNEAIQPNQACVYCEGDQGSRCLTSQ